MPRGLTHTTSSSNETVLTAATADQSQILLRAVRLAGAARLPLAATHRLRRRRHRDHTDLVSLILLFLCLLFRRRVVRSSLARLLSFLLFAAVRVRLLGRLLLLLLLLFLLLSLFRRRRHTAVFVGRRRQRRARCQRWCCSASRLLWECHVGIWIRPQSFEALQPALLQILCQLVALVVRIPCPLELPRQAIRGPILMLALSTFMSGHLLPAEAAPGLLRLEPLPATFV